jgi:prolyl oligopeptidase PreP (S9A serine peptidase family)
MTDSGAWRKEKRIWTRPAGVPPSTALTTRQEFYVARDGTRVPLFTVSGRDANVSNQNL